MFLKRNRRGQSTLEYGILIVVIVGALVAMSVYMKRGLQGKLKSSTDDIGEQYSPSFTTSEYTSTSDTDTNETLVNKATTTTILRDVRSRTGSETVEGFGSESW